MNAITHAFTSALLQFVWQGILISIVLWLALWMLRNRTAEARYLASCGALAALVLLPAATTWLNYEAPRGRTEAAAAVMAGARSLPRPSAAQSDWISGIEAWALPVWSAGLLVFSLRMLWGCSQIARIRRRGESADGAILARIEGLAARMGITRRVRVLVSEAADGPSMTGWLRPVILLPAAALAGLSTSQLEAVLAHELAHVRRADYLVNLLQMAAETLLFYHPAVWWVSARVREERELCCDDLAVATCEGPLCYARALAVLERLRISTPAMAMPGASGPLARRILRLVGGAREYGPSKLSGAAAFALGVACLAAQIHWAKADVPPAVESPQTQVEDAPGVTVDLGGAAVLHRRPMEYPGVLRERGIDGTVTIEAVLNAAGEVVDVHVVSGPDALRRTVILAVLDWHFAPAGAGVTRIGNVTFRAPSPSDPPRPARKADSLVVRKEQPDGRMAELERQAELVRAAMAEQQKQYGPNHPDVMAERAQVQALEQEMAKARSERNAGLAMEFMRMERSTILEREIAESQEALERQRATYGPNHADVQARRMMIEHLRSQLAELQARHSEILNQPLAQIQFRGVSQGPMELLRSTLPRLGDTLTPQVVESARKLVREFDSHLEATFEHGEAGVVMTIRPSDRQ